MAMVQAAYLWRIWKRRHAQMKQLADYWFKGVSAKGFVISGNGVFLIGGNKSPTVDGINVHDFSLRWKRV
jgi:hypothetical protein